MRSEAQSHSCGPQEVECLLLHAVGHRRVDEAGTDIDHANALGRETVAKAFEKAQIEEINPEGVAFNPELHEAMLAPPLASLLFIALGLPVYLFLVRQSRRTTDED